uniref:Uncharacterized protein n=1 Tax=Arundo donax TaxID=35708 RepID=A0A0A9C1H9_ARUDO
MPRAFFSPLTKYLEEKRKE